MSTRFISTKKKIQNTGEKNMEATVNTTAVSTVNNESRPALYHYTAGWEKIAAILPDEIISNMIHCIPAHN